MQTTRYLLQKHRRWPITNDKQYPRLVAIANWYYTFVYNFQCKGWYQNQQILMYQCNYLKIINAAFIGSASLCRRYPVPLRKKDSAQFYQDVATL